jgi:hypothetical protein
MTDLDNRIRLDQSIVDFTKSGTTGELHDEYPKPNTQARFDLMRTYLIGLLSNQSSDEDTDGEPFEKRTGTLWYKKKSALLELFNGTEFEDLSKHIGITIDKTKIPIESVILNILAALRYVAPRVIWCGRFDQNVTDIIQIPAAYQGYAAMPNMHPLVYINGLLIDPRDTTIQAGSPFYIKMNDNFIPEVGQKYTVILEQVSDITQEDIIGQG